MRAEPPEEDIEKQQELRSSHRSPEQHTLLKVFSAEGPPQKNEAALLRFS